MLGYIGSEKSSLKKVISEFKGTISFYYRKLINSPEFSQNDDMKEMYAPQVPHIFLYTHSQSLTPSHVEKI